MELKREHYGKALELLQAEGPRSMPVYHWIKFANNELFPPNYNHACFIDNWPNPLLWAGVYAENVPATTTSEPPLESAPIWFSINLHISPIVKDEQSILKFLKNILDKFSGSYTYFHIRGTAEFRAVYQEATAAANLVELKTFFPKFYWIPPSKFNEPAFAEKYLHVDIPEGFESGELTVDDASFVNENWRHKYIGSENTWVDRIKLLPSACIRDKATGMPVSFGLTNHYGSFTHLFTDPAYRGRGLATMVTKLWCKKYLEIGMIPYQFLLDDSVEALHLIAKEGLFVDGGCRNNASLFIKKE